MANWLASEPIFAESAAYERLHRSLRRYLSDEISGSSFLISGHRGAGKTTTVTHAVRRLRNDALLNSGAAQSVEVGRRRTLQRPLLVKLVGLSLIEPPPVLREPSPKAGGKPASEALAQHEPDPKAGETAAGGAPAKPAATSSAGNALAHITIGLFRALAAEVVRAFTTHAKDRLGPGRSETLEIAAQLALELDSNPDPATLRDLWQALERLDKGVLWPREGDETLGLLDMDDQGMREIVAVATAAQAFQVCSGEVTYTLTNKETASSDLERTSTFDSKELVSRIASLTAGTGAGAAAAVAEGSAMTGVGVGVLAFLASAFTLSQTWTRKRGSSRDVDYKFIRDRSLQTLDRDLPVVIERIRQAGLAPVFVVDELDKLEDTAETVAELIGRLKHLISDNGFFCFLSDRGYFEEIEAKIAGEAYPKESTYFSDRLLVLNRPGDLYDYLTELIVNADAGGPNPEADSGFAITRATLALAIMFRSKLNFTDVGRRLAELLDGDGNFTPTERNIFEPKALRLAATVQIAIMDVVRDPRIADRFASNPAFAHQMIDALYHIPRCWEKDPSKGCTLSRSRLKTILVDRVADSLGGGAARAIENDKLAELLVKDDDVATMFEMVIELAKRLASFSELEASVAKSEMKDAGLLRDIICTDQIGLIEGIESAPAAKPAAEPKRRRPASAAAPAAAPDELECTYKFRFNLEGISMEPSAPFRVLAPEQRARIASLKTGLKAFQALIGRSELTVESLAEIEVIERPVTTTRIAAAIQNLERASSQNLTSASLADDIQDAEALNAAIARRWKSLLEALWLISRVAKDVHPSPARSDVAERIARYWVKGTTVRSPIPVPQRILSLPFEGLVVESAMAELTSDADRPVLSTEDKREADRWLAWRDHVANYVASTPSEPLPKPSYDDLVQAAAGEEPGAIFRSDLRTMTAADWSRLALSALSPSEEAGPRAPQWALAAGLCQLGFGPLDRAFADEACREFTDPGDAGSERALGLIRSCAISGEPGLLYVCENGRRPDFPPSRDRDEAPLLVIERDQESAYLSALGWLASVGLLIGRVIEDDGNEDP